MKSVGNHGSLFYAYLNQVLKANEVSGESWLLATASHGEGDGLTISKVMTALIVLAVLVGFAESDNSYIQVMLWSFLCNLIDTFFSYISYAIMSRDWVSPLLNSCHISLGFAETDTMVTFKVILCSFLSNLKERYMPPCPSLPLASGSATKKLKIQLFSIIVLLCWADCIHLGCLSGWSWWSWWGCKYLQLMLSLPFTMGMV